MTDRAAKTQVKEEQKGSGEPKVQDISELVDQSTITLQDLDQRMQAMRTRLAQLMAQANQLQTAGLLPHQVQQQSPFAVPQGNFATQVPLGWPYRQEAQQASPYGAQQTAWQTGYSPAGASGGNVLGSQGVSGIGATGQVSPTGSPSLSPGQFGGETRTTRDIRDLPPQSRQPQGDVVDDGNNYQVQLEMPGVNKEDMDIMVTDRAILVTALARPDLDDGMLVVQERGPVVYRRTIQLPSEIKTSECHAKLRDGILRLSVPKKNPTEGPRHLEIAYG